MMTHLRTIIKPQDIAEAKSRATQTNALWAPDQDVWAKTSAVVYSQKILSRILWHPHSGIRQSAQRDLSSSLSESIRTSSEFTDRGSFTYKKTRVGWCVRRQNNEKANIYISYSS